MVGVLLNIPLTGLFQSVSSREAYRLEEKVAITRSRAELEIPLLIEKTYAELRALGLSYHAMEEGADLAKEGLRLAEVRFKSGDGSALEVLKSTTDWEKSPESDAVSSPKNLIENSSSSIPTRET